MNKTKQIKTLLASCLLTMCSFPALSLSAQTAEESYGDQDRYKAIIMCMTVEYVQFYQEYPAEEDVMDRCNARFQRLTQSIPYEQYKKLVLETPYTPYPSAETSAILEEYHRIMLGLDTDISIIN